MDEITITRHGNDQAGEYRAAVSGSDAVGRLTWITKDRARVAEHTLVPPQIGGRGVAGRLVEALIADARKEQFKIVPTCSYVAAAFKRHAEWQDLLA